MLPQAPGNGPCPFQCSFRGQGHWAICRANSAPTVLGPSNNVPLSDLGCNLCSQGLSLFSPHSLEGIVFHLGRKSAFPKLNFLTFYLCSESHYSAMVPALESKGEQDWFSSYIVFLMNRIVNANLARTVDHACKTWPPPPSSHLSPFLMFSFCSLADSCSFPLGAFVQDGLLISPA